MKSVLVSIQPKWCEKIVNGEKTIEVRKSAPKEVPFKCYIYCTKSEKNAFFTEEVFNGEKGKWAIPHIGNGKVIGEFICDKVTYMQAYIDKEYNSHLTNIDYDTLVKTCLSHYELFDYITNCATHTNISYKGCLWHISDLKIYDKPKELSEFRKPQERIAQTCGCLSNNGLCTAAKYEELCDNIKKCCFKTPLAPQSWMYVEEL